MRHGFFNTLAIEVLQQAPRPTITRKILPLSSSPVTLRRIFRLWLPLAGSWLMMGAEMPLFTIFVARMALPELNLAAWGSLVFPLSMVIEGPVIMLLAASTALATDSHNYKKLHRYMVGMSGVLTALHLLLAFTPFYDWAALQVLGVPPEVLEPGRIGLQIMTPWTAAIAWRRLNQGVLIRFGQSRAVAVGTLVRLIALVGALSWGYFQNTNTGVFVGAVAVAVGVIAEALFIHWATRPLIQERLPQEPKNPNPLYFSKFLWFYLPLAVTPLMTLFIQPAGAAGMSRMPNTLASLAAWPAVHGIIFLVRGSGFAFNEVVVALAGQPDGLHQLRIFARRLAGITVGILALIALTPFGHLWFKFISGLSTPLAALSAQAVMVAILMPGYQVYQSLFQGLLVYRRSTRPISEAVALYVCISLGGLWLGSHYATCSGILWVLGTFVLAGISQTFWLGWRVRNISES